MKSPEVYICFIYEIHVYLSSKNSTCEKTTHLISTKLVRNLLSTKHILMYSDSSKQRSESFVRPHCPSRGWVSVRFNLNIYNHFIEKIYCTTILSLRKELVGLCLFLLRFVKIQVWNLHTKLKARICSFTCICLKSPKLIFPTKVIIFLTLVIKLLLFLSTWKL